MYELTYIFEHPTLSSEHTNLKAYICFIVQKLSAIIPENFLCNHQTPQTYHSHVA